MEEKRRFVCRFCSKCFPSGKSLGGHIRTHMTHHHYNSSSDTNTTNIADDTLNKFNDQIDAAKKKRKKRDLGSDNYGLRENPRKTSRFVVQSNPTTTTTTFVHHHNEKFCKECGKGFPSLKALCGHMACHSHSTDTSAPKSSKRMRFMTLNNNNVPTSSSVSEVEQDEQEEEEEVALCLIMLSKDFSSSHRGGFALVTTHSNNSDNNSVVLEAKSPAGDDDDDTKFGKNRNRNRNRNMIKKNSVSNHASEVVEEKQIKKVRKDLKFKVSIDGVLRNGGFDPPKMEDSSKLKFDEIACKKKKEHGFPNDGIYKNSSYDSESYENESDDDDEEEEEEEKSTDSSSTDSDSYPSSSSSSPKPHSSKNKKKKMMMKSNKRKEHECPICNRIFKSGQALGGHKRSHFVGGGEDHNNNSTTLILKQDSPPHPSPSPSHGVPCLIDLNLPAPVDE